MAGQLEIDDQTSAGKNVGFEADARRASAAASAISIGQQLLTTVWNVVLVAVLVAAAFGRSGGKRLVEESSARARESQAEPRA